MARPRLLPDSQVFAAVLSLLAADGEKGVTFSSVSRKTGLAGASLVQRYGGLDGMMAASLAWGWTEFEAALERTVSKPQGIEERTGHGFLKLLAEEMPDLPLCAILALSQRDAGLRQRAQDWRQRVETALSTRGEGAAMLFALWMGQWLWEPMGGKGFKLKDAAKRLG
ncbi:transcriptional regulator [Stagnihabitans tardus]|uniref:Transcriptional regulator n=1 Tax=Stagnihabitans tardus TaxID=2699202 RepID=A0AAE5BVE3_9RHOB|nr:transcriptional regulator [Stagnihabitans tardus]NBZ88147.1 transcriptional regulator [Stagnihabitans tardus]